jgi:OOP family OmpA-OmpF porin
MARDKMNWSFLLMMGFFLASCATPRPMAEFKALDLNPKLRSGQLTQRVNTYLVLLDASGSMADAYKGEVKLDVAKNFVHRMNETLPEMELTGGLMRFGGTSNPFAKQTTLVYGLTDHSRPGLNEGLKTIEWGKGETPLTSAIEAATVDLKTTQGDVALLIVGDGRGKEVGLMQAVESMKGDYGDRLCIYTVVVGDDPAGKKNMEALASAGRCGFTVIEEDTVSKAAMADFVEAVFFAKQMDKDGDGVADRFDQCPDTPRGIKVDAKGCALPVAAPRVDSDGDGVFDNVDKCPGTPRGAEVDARGCWVIRGVKFDTDKSDIKPVHYPILDQVVDVLRKNPSLKIEIQGHTDNVGRAKYNQRLSERRALAVMEYLIRKGVGGERLNAVGYGLERPIASNSTQEGQAQNRRVELKPVL